MKKVIIVLFFLTILISFTSQDKEYIIPSDAIRLRVIANSNTLEDQNTKMEIKNNIENILATNIKSISKEETEQKIKENIPNIKEMVNNYNINYNLNFGNNYFPEKTYKGVKYEAGYYESLVLTLGQGKGDNWWCLLFPPLCYQDENNTSNKEYKLFVQEFIKKYM